MPDTPDDPNTLTDAADLPPVAPAAWEIVTRNGSRYGVRVDDAGRWWLSADNRPNPSSVSLADGEWEIQPPSPWPPMLGAPCWLWAPAQVRLGDPRRVPGGGKVTSAVTEATALLSPTASSPDPGRQP